MDFNNIKLVIWDLDDTFWKGTLSEESIIPNKDNIRLVKDLTDHGIINSICSKNDYEPVNNKLKELNIDNCFVFNSINWEPKGKRIKQTIGDMGLRPVNVLFIDDNIQNLNEAKFYSPELNIAEPSVILQLIEWINNTPNLKKDLKHSRLNQYKVLEQKRADKQNFSSNEEFLKESNIKINISTDIDEKTKERVFELIHRTNQLNFTKFRQSKEEFENLLKDISIKKGYVTVSDRYGDYGIVGFYAIKNNQLIHFLFSCRTIGQGVEQWVYSQLGFPNLSIKGECINSLNDYETPSWINQEISTDRKESHDSKEIIAYNHSILFKGPCDMINLKGYLNINCQIDEEFTYVSDKGFTIDYHNHSDIIKSIKTWTEKDKNFLSQLNNWDNNIFQSKLFNNAYDYVVLSTFNESHFRRIKFDNGITIPINKEFDFNLPTNDSQNKSYSWNELHKTSGEEYIEFLRYLDSTLNPKTKVILLLGSEVKCKKGEKGVCIDEERRQLIIKFNGIVRNFVDQNNRFSYIDVSDFIESDNDYIDGITHFSRKVYFQLANKIAKKINESSNLHISTIDQKWVFLDKIIYPIRKYLNPSSKIYQGLKKIYFKVRK